MGPVDLRVFHTARFTYFNKSSSVTSIEIGNEKALARPKFKVGQTSLQELEGRCFAELCFGQPGGINF